MKDIKVKIGLTGVVHPNMPGDDEGVYAGIIKSMELLQADLDFDLAVLPDPLRSEADGEAARKFLDDRQVDLTLIFNASLGYGRVILPLARVKSYIGLWSVPEPTRDGVLQLNSFCGLNMYGSIISNYLTLHRIPFKWFYGYTDAPMVEERFKITLAALRAIKVLQRSRIGQIGGLADGFENIYIDERELEKKFGTQLQTRHTVEDIVALNFRSFVRIKMQ